ncbi:MAG: FAD-dependent oxidoreductase [Syntrophales bacterium]|nr:FAD-dependent oxidoreductase [Syntrophales bacterium]
MINNSPNKIPQAAVLLLGAGYGAIKAAQDMAEAGKPLIWVTRAPHFLEVPLGKAAFTEWPEDLNFQFRPLYLRVTRHPLVTALTRTHVESIVREGEGYRVTLIQESPFVDYDLCTGCARCMEVCPLKDTTSPPLKRTPPYCPSRALDLDKRKKAPCREACPLGVNAQAYIALIAAGRFSEALEVIRRDNPLPGICGRVCHHPCEVACRRADVDAAVAICELKRFAADWELKAGKRPTLPPAGHKRQERVAIVGSGPAGLSAAYFLAREGFNVTVFEKESQLGGMLRIGINAFRLPRDILEMEIKAIEELGVEFKTSCPVTNVEELFEEGYKAVILCLGAHRDLKLGIPGENLPQVMGAVEMLKQVNMGSLKKLVGRVAVIGGGNSAIDAARAALRLGAEEVTIFYRREKGDMPALAKEIREAEEEGVNFTFRTAPVSIRGTSTVEAVEFIRMEMGEPDESGRRRPIPVEGSQFLSQADYVIVAIGQETDWSSLGGEFRWKDDRGRIVCLNGMMTGRPGLFAAGDVVTGPGTVVESMAQGRKAAADVADYLLGIEVRENEVTSFPGADYKEVPKVTEKLERVEARSREPHLRVKDFSEISHGLSEDEAIYEAKRCIQCAVCCECLACEEVCRSIGAIDHTRLPRTISFYAPAIVVAREEELADKKMLSEKQVHYIGSFNEATDIVNVLMAGSAAAGRAIMDTPSFGERKKGSRRTRLFQGDERKIGVFICTCNGTMAPTSVLENLTHLASLMPGVEKSALVFSACHPQGAEQIAREVRKNKLGRNILLSCACCPLEFQCISCNDQRNRVRLHLFNRLGLDRSRFEMVNMRDGLGYGMWSDNRMLARARDLLRESYFRLQFLGPLQEGQTSLGRSVLILGGSEVGIICARILDLQGFRVRLVHRCRIKGEELPSDVARRSLTEVEGQGVENISEAIVWGIKGHLGNFETRLEIEGRKRVLNSDIVCLTDLHLLPLAIPEGTFGLKKFYRYNFAFFNTPQIGLYRVMPRTLKRVSAGQAGAALAAHVASAAAEAYLKDHELSPRVDETRCRGCGRCVEICPFRAVTFKANSFGFYTAQVLRYNCVGCGGCVGRCPVTAMDMPYFSNRFLDDIVPFIFEGGKEPCR